MLPTPSSPLGAPPARRKLPIGIQTFREIIEEGYYYVDKSGYAVDLAASGEAAVEKSGPDAFELVLQHAQTLGANAVVGLRYDATEVMQGVTEVLCYGTAVVVARE